MKKVALAALTGAALSGGAAFAQVPLPTGPLYMQYSNAEQFSAANAITTTNASGSTVNEGLWGIAQFSIGQQGTALNPQGSDIQGGGPLFFADQAIPPGGQITGIFYGFTTTGSTGGGGGSPPTTATLEGGYLDLWWDGSQANAGDTAANVGNELTSASNITTKRTSQACYTGFACDPDMTFLVRLVFSPGVLASTGDLTTTDTATLNSASDGVAKAYLDVDMSAGGAWASALNTNFFTLDPTNALWSVYGLLAKDIRLDTNFSVNGATAWSVGGTDIVGLRTNDPMRAFAVPEPDMLALVSLGLFGLGVSRRRKAS